MTGPFGGGRDGEDGEEGTEPTGFPRIPGPRAAGDDLDPPPRLDPVPPAAGPAPASPEPPAAPAPAVDPWDSWESWDRAVETSGPAAVRPQPPGTGPGAGAGDVPPAPPPLSHKVLKSLLGAWALSACSAEETTLVEDHLTECAPCADEALRLRDAVELLHTDHTLDLDPLLRSRVLANCLGRRPARIPVPDWAGPYDVEAARLDALLRDIGEADWHAPVRLRWFEDEQPTSRKATVAGVIGHLMVVDGLVATALGLDDPLGADAPGLPNVPLAPTIRTESFWRSVGLPLTRDVHEPWRGQSHTLIRTVSFAGRGVGELSVSYGDFSLPLRDALLDRAFECWVHGWDIADAVDYPYEPPTGAHLHRMIDLAARLLPAALATRRRAGLASPARHLVTPGSPGRSLHLEVEGPGGGDWFIALDSPAAIGTRERSVAQVALDGVEFCQLVAGHVSPQDAAAGQDGDREAIRDVLFAAAALSRL